MIDVAPLKSKPISALMQSWLKLAIITLLSNSEPPPPMVLIKIYGWLKDRLIELRLDLVPAKKWFQLILQNPIFVYDIDITLTDLDP